MIVQPISDAHSDVPGFSGYPPPAPGVDLVLVAGDVREGLAAAIREVRRAYPAPTAVCLVAGNHEFWRSVHAQQIEEGRRAALLHDVHLLERDEVRDHKRIAWSKDPWRRFRPQEARALHVRSRDFIERELARDRCPTVVLTHFPPVPEAITPEQRRSLTAAAACSDLSHLFKVEYAPTHWIFGHTHRAMNARRGPTRLISNPIGYPGERTGFDATFTFEAPT